MAELKRVSFKIANAIKEAGYPQGETSLQYVTKDIDTFKCGDIIDAFYENWAANNTIDAPFVMEVWLWLWREKHIKISSQLWYDGLDKWGSIIETATFYDEMYDYTDPEEAIIAAIEYLATNDLIK